MYRTFALALLAASLLATPAVAQITTAEAPATVAPVSAERFATATQRILATMEQITRVQGASPALAVVMVRRGQEPVIWVHGPLSTANPSILANGDTPFYIASQTKAFVGLMALKLHDRGVFSLDQTLADVWPDVTFPEGIDPRAITFRQLLSHQGAFQNETIEWRVAYADLVPSREYGHLLGAYSAPRAPGFEYANLGYNVYTAALELRTGHDWRYWLEAEVLRPTGMNRSGPRVSRFPRAELPTYHQWMGGNEWRLFAGKTDYIMQSAGGLVASPNDMARWLQLQLGERPDVVSPELLAQSQSLQIAADIQGEPLDCQGYAIGWNVCRVGAVDIRAHGGGYTAVRSVMAVSPELGVGYAFLSNSDSLTGALSQLTTELFFQVVQDPEYGPTPEEYYNQLSARLPRLVEGRRNDVAERRTEAQWEGWAWRPANAELRGYTGRYRSARLGEFRVTLRNGQLYAALGAMNAQLEPAKRDLFGFAEGPLDPPAPFAFERSGNHITALSWDDERFERVR